MKLYYHIDPLGNFGDDLNPWLWNRIFADCFDGYIPHDPGARNDATNLDSLFVGIGTLLNRHIPIDVRKVVFGSGAGYGTKPDLNETWDIVCVRGPLTANALGIDTKFAITDPAILATRYFPASPSKEHTCSYMPHCSSARLGAVWQKICAGLGINYIDPQQHVDIVLSEISKSKYLITEALHGAILADAMRVPWISVCSSSAVLDFKWLDWAASLGFQHESVALPPLWPGYDSSAINKGKSYLKVRVIEKRLRDTLRSESYFLSNENNLACAFEAFDEKIALVTSKYFCH